MTYTLTVSSQGQVIIPAPARRILGIEPGAKISLAIDSSGAIPTGTILPQPKSWVKAAQGLGKGLWGKGEEYIKKERQTWDH